MLKLIPYPKQVLLILCFAGILACSCKKNEIYPEIPSIAYKDAYVLFDRSNVDSLIILVFTYKDGDGDIGLEEGQVNYPYQYDSLGPNKSNTNRFYNNIFIDYYAKQDGEYFIPTVPLTNDTVNKDVRVGSLTPDGIHKAIRGEITIGILPIDYATDTLKLRVRLVDRALHISNEVETPDLYLTR